MTEYSEQNKKRIQELSSSTRKNRRLHRILSISLATILLISALTGLLLAWKKESNLIQPQSQNGSGLELSNWKSVEELSLIAVLAMDSLGIDSKEIDRLDFRPDKGIVKVLFKKGYWEVQVDCTNGKVLSAQRRYSDLIEQIHDGSIISDGFKLGAMNIFGLALVVLITTGFLLWYGPRKIRKIKSE